MVIDQCYITVAGYRATTSWGKLAMTTAICNVESCRIPETSRIGETITLSLPSGMSQ